MSNITRKEIEPVFFLQDMNKWKFLVKDGDSFAQGLFETEEEARECYDDCVKYHNLPNYYHK